MAVKMPWTADRTAVIAALDEAWLRGADVPQETFTDYLADALIERFEIHERGSVRPDE